MLQKLNTTDFNLLKFSLQPYANRLLICTVLASACATGCFTNKDSQPNSTEAPLATSPAPAAEPPALEIKTIRCHPGPAASPTPFYHEPTGIVVSEVQGTCVGPSGTRGIQENASWIAMGFPCTGGGGRVELRGDYHSPKLVSFLFGTDCPMNPPAHDKLAKAQSDLFPKGIKAVRLSAYYPLAVQYWELPDFNDADIGFSIDLRTKAELQDGWDKFRSDRPLNVNLYGKQSSWSASSDFYAINGSIIRVSRNSFKFKVLRVKPMTELELNELKQRCYGLSPKRNCAKIF